MESNYFSSSESEDKKKDEKSESKKTSKDSAESSKRLGILAQISAEKPEADNKETPEKKSIWKLAEDEKPAEKQSADEDPLQEVLEDIPGASEEETKDTDTAEPIVQDEEFSEFLDERTSELKDQLQHEDLDEDAKAEVEAQLHHVEATADSHEAGAEPEEALAAAKDEVLADLPSTAETEPDETPEEETEPFEAPPEVPLAATSAEEEKEEPISSTPPTASGTTPPPALPPLPSPSVGGPMGHGSSLPPIGAPEVQPPAGPLAPAEGVAVERATSSPRRGGLQFILGLAIGHRWGRKSEERKTKPVIEEQKQTIDELKDQVAANEAAISNVIKAQQAARMGEAPAREAPVASPVEVAPELAEQKTPTETEEASAPLPHSPLESVESLQREQVPGPFVEEIQQPVTAEKLGERLSDDRIEKEPGVEKIPVPAVHVERLSTPELLQIAATIHVEGTTIRRLYETNQLDRHGLEEVVKKHLNHEDIAPALDKYLLGREVMQERAREFKHDPGAQDDASTVAGLVNQPLVTQHAQQPGQLLPHPQQHLPGSPTDEPLLPMGQPEVLLPEHIAPQKTKSSAQPVAIIGLVVLILIFLGFLVRFLLSL